MFFTSFLSKMRHLFVTHGRGGVGVGGKQFKCFVVFFFKPNHQFMKHRKVS